MRQKPSAQQTLAAILLLLPALAGAVAIADADFSSRARQAAAAEPAPGDSLAWALREDAIETAYVFLRAGQDPNAPIPYQDEQLTGGHEIRVTPLMIAIANHRQNSVLMLLSHGARLDARGNAGALCLANALGDAQIVNVLTAGKGADAASACSPETASREASLLDVAQ